jgi:TonB family protein
MDALFAYLESHSVGLLDGWLTMQLQTGIFVLVVLAIDLSMRKAAPRFRYLLWMTALVKAVLPPVFHIPATGPAAVQAWYALPSVSVAALATEPLSAGLSFSAAAVLFLLTSSLAFALFVLQRSMRLHLQLRDARPLQHDAWRRGPQVYVSDRISSPLAAGMLHPRIYVTEHIASSSRQTLCAVLHHERAHIDRRDGLVVLLQIMIQVVYLLNPLVWLLNIRLFRYREQICDQQALLRTGTRPVDYGRLLLHFAGAHSTRIVQTGTCFFETRRGFADRIGQLFTGKEERNMKIFHRIAIVLLVLLIAPLSWKCSEDAKPAKYLEWDGESFDTAVGDSAQEDSARLLLGDPIFSTVRYEKKGEWRSGHGPQIVGGLEALSKLVKYPAEARKEGIEGTVVIQATIVEDGSPVSAHVISSVHPLLDKAAQEAVRAATFKAARRNGVVLEADISIPIRFKLK